MEASHRARSKIATLEKHLHDLFASHEDTGVIGSEPLADSIGLECLFIPAEPLVDIIFVHGFWGGARKSWSKSMLPSKFWPKEWLSKDPAFEHARISTYGYAADFQNEREGAQDLSKLGAKFFQELKSSSYINDNCVTSIILIGHGMGGLVIKKAYLLAEQHKSTCSISERLHSIFFLATPHHGADSDQLLRNMYQASMQPVSSHEEDVRIKAKHAESRQQINDEFRRNHRGLHFWSFYETRETTMGPGRAFLVVDKDSATLDASEFQGEKTCAIDSNHMDICKFDCPSDPNFRVLRDTLAGMIEELVKGTPAPKRDEKIDQLRLLREYLKEPADPQEEFGRLEDVREHGSCEWLTEKEGYLRWQNDEIKSPAFFWLKGKPAAGKSVIAAYVIRHLKNLNRSCSYFFFANSDQSRKSVTGLLCSIAYQMAASSRSVREKISDLRQSGAHFNHENSSSVWQKLFVEGVLRASFHEPHYWVIDALEECNDYEGFSLILGKINSHANLRIFLTSRDMPGFDQVFHRIAGVCVENISSEDTDTDIRLFLCKNQRHLPADDEECAQLIEDLLERSEGSFLWAGLVFRELKAANTEEDKQRVMREIPTGMGRLYDRMLETIDERNKEIAKAILKWTVCATRPLSVDELHEALHLDINKSVIKKSLPSLCRQLISIDKNQFVHIVHRTAREFLIRPDLHSASEKGFAIDLQDGHTHLAQTCLKYLTSDEMKGPSFRSRQNTHKPRSAFAEYACTSFSHHLTSAGKSTDSLMATMNQFLNGNVLSWVEFIASRQNLSPLIKAAKDFRSFVRLQTDEEPAHEALKCNIETWANDLIHLVTRLGRNLLKSPSAIFFLVAPLCPPESAIFRTFGAKGGGLTVAGLSGRRWEDRLACISYLGDQPLALACRDNRFAVGLQSGLVILYDTSSCQELKRFQHGKHGEGVQVLEFAATSTYLASSGGKTIKIWDTKSEDQVCLFSVANEPLALAFDRNDESVDLLLAATKGNHIATFRISDGSEMPMYDLNDSNISITRPGTIRSAPEVARFSVALKILAMEYRGQPISLWDLAEKQLLNKCSKGPATAKIPSVTDMVFHPNPDAKLLAAAYLDSDLVVYDLDSGDPKNIAKAVDAQILAVSPDGRTLAGGNSESIQLFDFETLKLMHTIHCNEDIKGLAFSSDGLRFYDIREEQCNIWEPAVLVRKDTNDGFSESSFESLTPSADPPIKHASAKFEVEPVVTAMACDALGEFLFYGTECGEVCVRETGSATDARELYRHRKNVAISALALSNNHVLASADVSGRLLVYQCNNNNGKWTVRRTYFEKEMREPILQVVMQERGECVMIVVRSKVVIWQIGGKSVAEPVVPMTTGEGIWSDDPLNHDRVLFTDSTASRVYEWATGRELTSPWGGFYPYEGTKDVPGDSLTRQRALRLVCELRKFEPHKHNVSLNSFPFAKQLLKEQEMIIGIYSDRLVFLDWDKWVCTIDVNGLTNGSFRRHFFLPFDWLAPNRDLLVQVTSRGDVLVAKGVEIAVIRRGLDFGERVQWDDD